MAHFARIQGDTVGHVIVVNNDAIGGGTFPDSEPLGQELIASIGLDGEWRQCSYNGNFRGVYPGMGFTFDGTDFIPPAIEAT